MYFIEDKFSTVFDKLVTLNSERKDDRVTYTFPQERHAFLKRIFVNDANIEKILFMADNMVIFKINNMEALRAFTQIEAPYLPIPFLFYGTGIPLFDNYRLEVFMKEDGSIPEIQAEYYKSEDISDVLKYSIFNPHECFDKIYSISTPLLLFIKEHISPVEVLYQNEKYVTKYKASFIIPMQFNDVYIYCKQIPILNIPITKVSKDIYKLYQPSFNTKLEVELEEEGNITLIHSMDNSLMFCGQICMYKYTT